MKKRFLPILLLLLTLSLLSAAFVSCDDQKKNLQKLNAPVVVLEGDLATWLADTNADKFEISVDGSLSYLENTVTSKKLTDGQTFKIRAVGDNTSYATSDWSNAVTYSVSSDETDGNDQTTADQTDETSDNTTETNGDETNGDETGADNPDPPAGPTAKAPSYLTILASNTEPSRTDLPTLPIPATLYYASAGQIPSSALSGLLTDPDLLMGDTLPTASDYSVYSAAGNTVYIQIWLDNPDQNTILSIKLGGTKYQSGGALRSFFIKSGDTYLNCVYVAVTIPSDAYGEITYQVTEIEYVEGNNISQEGKSVLIAPENDSVAVGLRYKDSDLDISSASAVPSASTVTWSVSVTDSGNYLTKTGGWLRAVLLDAEGGYAILSQKKLTVGDNTITFDGLRASKRYAVAVVLVADIHDGEGVAVHVLAVESFTTLPVFTGELESTTVRDETNGRIYASISVKGALSDSSFSFSKVEIYRYSYPVSAENLVYSGAFTGSAEIREGILSDKDYLVRVYYKNNVGAEQYIEGHVYTHRLYMPTYTLRTEYGLLQHAIIGFYTGEENPCNVDNLTLLVWRETAKQYIAEDAIYLLDNPNAIDDLQTRLDSLDRFENNEEFNAVYRELDRLEGVRQRMDNEYSELTRADWEALAAGSPYFYEIEIDESADVFYGDDGTCYVTLRDYQNLCGEDSVRYKLIADLDFNDGESAQPDQTLCEGFFNVSPAITDRDYLIIASDEDFNNLFTIDDNRLYLEVMSRNNLGNESYRALGYVNQIVLAKESSYDIVEVLWSQDAPDATIDEAAWLADVIEALLAGDEPDSVFPLGDLEPIEIDIHPTTKIPGNYHIRFTYRMLGKTYTDENPYDWDGAVVDYLVTAPLPTASITMEKEYPEHCGAWEIVFPELTIGHYWDHYVVEICDANGTLLHTYTQENPYDRARLEIGQKIRIRLLASDGVPYYTDGEWSDWFICEPIKIQTPVLYTGYSGSDLTVWWYEVSYAEKYLCTVNGIEQTVTETTLTVPNGAKVTVVAVPAEGGNCTSSDPSEEITATDTREQLATPNVTFEVDSEGVMVHVRWDAVDGAARYEIYNVTEDRVVRMLGASNTSYVFKTAQGGTYRIRALPENYDEYRASDYSILISW